MHKKFLTNLKLVDQKTKAEKEAQKIYEKYLVDEEAEILNEITSAILMQLTKTDTDRFKKVTKNIFTKK